MEVVLLLLSLSTNYALLTIEAENSCPICFSCSFCSNRDECHKFFVGSLNFPCILEGFGLFDPEEVELLASTGVGSTYELNFCDKDECICLSFSLATSLLSTKSRAD